MGALDGIEGIWRHLHDLVVRPDAPARAGGDQPTIAGDPSGARRGVNDGPGVRREVRTTRQLVDAHPELAGRLDPPTGGAAPAGVRLRTEADGTRVLTINVHEGVPGGVTMTGRNQRLEPLRDIARTINAVDPDVVLVQELTSKRNNSFGPDLEEQPSIVAHLIGASDMAFTPAFRAHWGEGETGTAVFTRNGYTIDRAINAALPDGEATQPRGAAIASVRAPGASRADAITVIGTHLAHAAINRDARARELEAIAGLVHDLKGDGRVRYTPRIDAGFHWPWESTARDAAGFGASRIVLGGDLNATQGETATSGATPDSTLGAVGLTHTLDMLGASDPAAARAADEPTVGRRRIDHLYARGFAVTDAAVVRVPSVETAGGLPPTDHHGFVADLR